VRESLFLSKGDRLPEGKTLRKMALTSSLQNKEIALTRTKRDFEALWSQASNLEMFANSEYRRGSAQAFE